MRIPSLLPWRCTKERHWNWWHKSCNACHRKWLAQREEQRIHRMPSGGGGRHGWN